MNLPLRVLFQPVSIVALALIGCDATPITKPPETPKPQQPLTLHGKTVTETIKGKVVAVYDGDTLTLLHGDNEEAKIRLDSIDTPEKRGGQPFSEKSKQALSELVFGRDVTIHQTDVDRWGRLIAFVFVDDVDISAKMVADGWAWEFDKYSKSDTLDGLESSARSLELVCGLIQSHRFHRGNFESDNAGRIIPTLSEGKRKASEPTSTEKGMPMKRDMDRVRELLLD